MSFRRYAVERTASAFFGFFLALCLVALIFRTLPWVVRQQDPQLRRQIREHARGSYPEDVAHVLGNVVRADLGTTFYGEHVADRLAAALPVTIGVTVGAMLLALVAALVVCVVPSRDGVRWLSYVTFGLQPSWAGLWLALALGVHLGLTPITGYCDFFNPDTACGGPAQWAWHLVLPWIVLAFPLFAVYVRVLRSVWSRVGAGEGERRLRLLKVAKHVGRDFGFALGLTTFAEVVFGLPGLGVLLVHGVVAAELPTGEGVLIVASALAVSAALVVDLVCGALEPALRRP